MTEVSTGGEQVRVCYDPDAADFRVFAMGLGGVGLFGLWLLGHGQWAFFIGAAAIFGAVYFFPLSQKKAARLVADRAGLTVDGLGVIPWHQISDMRMLNVAVRTMSNRDLIVTLGAPLEDALIEDARAPFPLGWLSYRLWRRAGRDVVKVNLEVLAGEPEQVAQRIIGARNAFSGAS